MSDQRPEIERWVPSEGMDSIVAFPSLAHITDIYYVLHSDHLRHLTLAKIELCEDLRAVSDPMGIIANTIAALRKELEG